MGIDRRLLVVVLIGILLRLIPSIAANIVQTEDALYDGDSYSYRQVGKGIAELDFLLTKGIPKEMASFRTPGYPLFLSLFYFFGIGDGLISIAQVLLEGASIFLIYKISLRIFKKEEIALITALLYALSPMFISFSFKIVSESFFAFVFLAMNYFFFEYLNGQKKHLLYFALMLAFLIMVRPVSLGFPVIYGLVMFFDKKPVKEILIAVIVAYLFTGLWVGRNLLVLNELTFSSISSISYICWTGPVMFTDAEVNSNRWKSEISEFGLDFPDKCAAKLNKSNMDRAQKVFNEVVGTYPLVYLKNNAKAAVLLFAPQTPNYLLESFGMETPHLGYVIFGSGLNLNAILGEIGTNWVYIALLGMFIIYQIVVYLSAITMAIKNQKESQTVSYLLLMGIAYLIVVHGPQLLFSGYRYRLPVEPFIVLLAGAGIFYIFAELRKRGLVK